MNTNEPMETVSVYVDGDCPGCGNNIYATAKHPIPLGSYGHLVFVTVQCGNSDCRELVQLSGEY